MRRTVLGLFLFAIAFIGFFTRNGHESHGSNAAAASTIARVGDALPDFTVQRLDRTKVSVRSYLGHPLWINLFATWCPPCNDEMPHIEREYAKHHGNLVVLALDQQESPKLVNAFVKRYRLTFPVAIDGGDAASAFAVNGLPASIFVDERGIVRKVLLGELSPSEMQAAITLILQRNDGS